ncbi:hypothetical protein [Cerasicoccus maritimus]|uniref:hypothetical protein n=1 Tax=Cerasicoccus maritimus TaxID=490089 RepID=UPI00285284C3|nr:hypothetical protein [Cerasicoccus maritimus]
MDFKKHLINLRNEYLRNQNSRQMAKSYRADSSSAFSNFILASIPDCHLAPLAICNRHPRVNTYVIGNGISDQQFEWLKEKCAPVPVIKLLASMRKGRPTYLAHGELITMANKVSRGDFCIQDADLFVMDKSWWENMLEMTSDSYALGPYDKPFAHLDGVLPDTFVVRIQQELYRKLTAQYNISPDVGKAISSEMATLLQSNKLDPTTYCAEQGKTYNDTLHYYWSAANIEGYSMQTCPGAEELTFHVGGTSYITGADIQDPSHWDYWPVNTVYFNLKLAEAPFYREFQGAFKILKEKHHSAQALIEKYPEYLKSKRYKSSQKIFRAFANKLGADLSA